MSKLIIHIGVGKTGTTSLQNNLFINLPGYKCLGRPNHQRYEYRNFFKGIMTAESYELDHLAIPFCEIVNSYLESGVSVIISDECLLSYKQPFSHVFYRLKKCFPNAEILVTLRNQLTAIPSFYYHEGFFLKSVPNADFFNRKKIISLSDFLEFYLSSDVNSYLNCLSYEKLLKSLELFFDKSNIHLLLFEDMVNAEYHFFNMLSNILGIEHSILLNLWNDKPVLNKGVSGDDLILKKIRSLIPIKSVSSIIPFTGFMKSTLSSFIPRKKRYSIEDFPTYLTRINTFYDADNNYVRSQYGIDLAAYKYPVIKYQN